jgi:hypothetical protein
MSEHLREGASSSTAAKKVVKLVGGGYFEPFVYHADDYNWAKYDARTDKMDSKER